MLAMVTGVSEDIQTPFWIKASWAAIDGEHPELIRPRPSGFVFMPRVGAFVEVEPIPGRDDEYWWFGRAIAAEDMPPAMKLAHPTVAGLISPTGRFYVVFDDRRGPLGGLRLHAGPDTRIIVGEGAVTILVGPEGQEKAKATLKQDGTVEFVARKLTLGGTAPAKVTLGEDGTVVAEGEELLLGAPDAADGAARLGDGVQLGETFQTWCSAVGAALPVPIPWPPPGYPIPGGAIRGAIIEGSEKVKVA